MSDDEAFKDRRVVRVGATRDLKIVRAILDNGEAHDFVAPAHLTFEERRQFLLSALEAINGRPTNEAAAKLLEETTPQ